MILVRRLPEVPLMIENHPGEPDHLSQDSPDKITVICWSNRRAFYCSLNSTVVSLRLQKFCHSCDSRFLPRAIDIIWSFLSSALLGHSIGVILKQRGVNRC